MKVRSFTYSRYHGKGTVGSTRLRVKQLQKYWPDYQDYKYAENPDAIVFQKVYVQPDWKFIEHFKGLKILDICDPDWLESQNVKETVEAVDAIVCPTQPLADFLAQLTDKPIRVIPDRHDLFLLPPPKSHQGELKRACWFGYNQNAELLKPVMPVLERENIELTVISNDDPFAQRWATEAYEPNYHFKKFDEDTIAYDLKAFDVCILPQGNRPQDRFKSNNKTTLAQLVGLPVVTNAEELETMRSAKARNELSEREYNRAKELYDVRLSTKEMGEFIDELIQKKAKR